jgi:hypothetical protein
MFACEMSWRYTIFEREGRSSQSGSVQIERISLTYLLTAITTRRSTL